MAPTGSWVCDRVPGKNSLCEKYSGFFVKNQTEA